MRHEVYCPGCGELMRTQDFSDAPFVKQHVDQIKREKAKAARAKGGKFKASAVALEDHELEPVREQIRAMQAARLEAHPETHYHRCGAVVQEVGDPTAPLGRRLVTLRGKGEGLPHEPVASAPPGTNDHRRQP